MTIELAGCAPAPNAWLLAGFTHRGRKNNLPKGFRLYCGAEWLRKYRGDPMPLGDAEAKYQLSLPDLDSRFYLLDLEAEPPTHGRYMSFTESLRRYWDIYWAFDDIVRHGREWRPYKRTKWPHRSEGAPWLTENDGPTAEWRARAKAIWAALPTNDSDIFARKAETDEPKHAHLAERLAPLKTWAGMRKPLSLDGTNWLQADNDSYFDGEAAPKPASNWERRLRPGSTDAELKSFIEKAGPCEVRKSARKGGGGVLELVPTDAAWPRRAGKLHIANGETEANGVRVEAGTILHQPDKFGELLGPEPTQDDIDMTRAWAARVYGRPRTMDGKPIDADAMETDEKVIDDRIFMVPRPFKPAGRIRRKVKITRAEQLELLAGPLPPVTYCPPGMANGSADLRGIFNGAEIMSTTGIQPVERWEDVSDEMTKQAEFEAWATALPPEQQKALNLACVAANFKEVGEAFGKQGKNAERYGKKIVLAANDNLQKVMAA